MERQILDQLQDEVNKIAKEELDQGWQGREKRDPTPDEFMGSDI
jgi:hypothetical protein